MKRKDLEQVFYLKKELRKWQHELAELQTDIAMSPKMPDGMPFQNTNKVNAPVEEIAVKIADTEKIIEGKITEIKMAICEIDNFISSLDDSFTRQVVYGRCVRNLSWNEIAFDLGEGYSAETVRQHYHRFIKRLSE